MKFAKIRRKKKTDLDVIDVSALTTFTRRIHPGY